MKIPQRLPIFLFLLALPPLHAVEPPAPGAVVLEVAAGKHHRDNNTPVFAEIPASLAKNEHLVLTPASSDSAIPVQRTGGKKHPRIAWLLEAPLQPGKERRYVLEPGDKPARHAGEGVACIDDGKHLLLKVGDRTVLQYNHAVVEPPEGIDPAYRRSGHIHPLYNPAGQIVTGDFAADHPHQHGVFFPWRKVVHQGRAISFWDEKSGTGKIEHIEVRRTASGPVFAEIVVALHHKDLTAPGGPIAALEEIRTIRAYNVRDRFLIDIRSVQRCAANAPLIVEEYHYGGMAIRGNAQWLSNAETAKRVKELTKSGASPEKLAALSKPHDYLTSEGKTWADGNATRARWVDMHGKIDGKPTGVTVFCHPKNFRAPQPVRLHPSKPYFCFAPMALGEFTIEPDKPFVSRYRYAVHSGPADAKISERIWRDYAAPPSVSVVLP